MRKFVSLVVLLYLTFTVNAIYAGLPTARGPVRILSKSVVQDFFLYAPNRISTYISNVGELVSFRVTGNAGMEWPKGSGKSINFQSGLWIGGLVGTQIRTAAAEYTVEFVPGTYEDWRKGDDSKYKIYTITRDDIIDEPGDDYLNWPFEDGAPMLLDDDGNIILDDDGNMIPGLIGTQLSWSVFNDANPTAHTEPFNTPPLGVEVQQTIWSFNRADAFGDMMFMKYLIINKGGNLIDDTYLSFWADIDLGNASDDLVGSDTLLSLGYNYNEDADNIYGAAPPAIGYDFFQGPIVESAGDTAKVSRHFRSSGRVPGFKNLPMTSVAHYWNSAPPGSGDPETAQEMYWFQQGLDGLGFIKIDPTTDLPTKFSAPGDPVTGEGWILTAAHDYRFMLTTGPFTLAPGDTQELVGGIIIAQGTSALNSITKLKATDRSAQIAYDIDFSLAAAPPAPNVTVGSLPGEIVLTWEPNSEVYHENDKVVPHPVTFGETFYDFQGYNIFQVNGPVPGPAQEFHLLATFDIVDSLLDIKDLVEIGKDVFLVTVQEADNSGIQRFINITTDKFTGLGLINYRKYYFMVEAYGVNPFGVPKILSSATLVTAIPGAPAAGTVLTYTSESVITDFKRIDAAPNKAIADIELSGKIVDPNQTEDKTYEITFFTAIDTTIDTLQVPSDTTITIRDHMWRMTDLSTNSVAIDSQGTKRDDKGLVNFDSLFIDPVQVILYDGLSVSLNGTYLAPVDHNANQSSQTVNKDPTTVMNFIGTIKTVNIKDRGLIRDLSSRPLMGGVEPLIFRRDIEIKITSSGSKATVYSSVVGILLGTSNPDTVAQVSYEVWDIEYDDGDGTIGRQINSILIDDEADDDSTNGFLGATNGDRDIIIPIYSAYDESLHVITDTMAAWGLYFLQEDSILVVSATFDSTYISAGASVGDVYQINFTNHIVLDEDVLRFTTLAPIFDNDSARTSEIAKINVFPNPYLGQNVEEIDLHNKFVTFTHLPPKDVTIRIFTLAGHLVTSIRHNNGTPLEKWNLNNARNIPVASGMYIAHIEVEGGASKILKLAIFMPEERLDLF